MLTPNLKIFIDTLTCLHGPLGDIFHRGPERGSLRPVNERFADARADLNDCTYGIVVQRILEAAKVGVTLSVLPQTLLTYLITRKTESMSKTWPFMSRLSAIKLHACIAPSIMSPDGSSAEFGNPTVLPIRILQMFQFAFLIRHPRHSIPSLYRISIPPHSSRTGWHGYLPSKEGYVELRKSFDFVRAQNTDMAETEGTGSASGTLLDCPICRRCASKLADYRKTEGFVLSTPMIC